MIDHPFRQLIGKRVSFLVTLYRRLGLSPNHVTVIGFLFAIAAAVMVALRYEIMALALWWVGRIFDGTDGIYARAIGRVSDYGGYLDIVCDMASYSAMVIGFSVAMPELHHYWIVILCLYVLCITSALSLGRLQEKRVGSAYDNRTLSLAQGLAEGGETGIFYSLLLLIPNQAHALCFVWIIMLAVTVVARTLIAHRMT